MEKQLPNKNNYKILIVEDEEISNKMVAQIVENDGYKCLQAYTGKQAINITENEQVDLILLDLMLPDIDGFAICKQLKSKRKTNIIPIIMITALVDFKNMINGIMVGADRYLTKPFNNDELLSEIERLLLWKENFAKDGNVCETVGFTMNSEIKYLEEINHMIAAILKKTSLDEETIEEIKSGIYEIGVNAIEWGNKFSSDLFIKFYYEITDHYLKISIEDEGQGFNFKDYLSNNYKAMESQDERQTNGKRLGGFGIIMAKKYFDSIEYNETGNKAILYREFK